MKKLVNKTVNLDLSGTDGNAFVLLGKFGREARRQGWTHQEIDLVVEECKKGDYDHLLATLLLYCEPSDENDSEYSEIENQE
ncbi:hypothetical protein [Chryseobacterium oryctis]|uniref:Phage protein n=1 Tax=Chryseobacterium oryctis TaxID=2952618 RepID=A0ABT3HIQ4_9FLAO|nr:hypothetical protein [Chryseobacterium oryctis]MCW3159667.1 hypothetical protein [Chryseobacterium oryctis]